MMLAVRPVITTPIMPMTTTAVLAMVLALVGFFEGKIAFS